MADQSAHLVGVVGPPLDQRQGLQHRVVDPSGELDALVLTDPCGAFLGGLPPVAQQPRPDDEDQAERGDDGGKERAAGDRERVLRREEGAHADQHQRDPAEVAHRHPATLAGQGGSLPLGDRAPAVAAGVVGLPPQHCRAGDHRGGRPDQPGAEPQQLGEQQHRRTQCGESDELHPRLGTFARRRIGSIGSWRLRHDDPERGVEDDAEPTEDDAGNERDAKEQDVDAEMVRQSCGHAPDEPPVPLPVQPPQRPRDNGSGHAQIVTRSG